MDDFGNSRTVYMVRNNKILDWLSTVKVSDFYLSVSDRTKIKTRADATANLLKQWLEPIIDLSAFEGFYHSNGTHSSIEQWMASEQRPICCLRGEYPYPSKLRNITVVNSVEEIPDNAVVYMSNPFSANGNYDLRYEQIKNPVVLDIAYVGTTKQRSINITPNTEQVFWSASKPFGLGNFRTGYRFSRKKDLLQENIKDTGYYNLLGIEALNYAISNFTVTELFELYYTTYEKICTRNNLMTTDSFLLAISTDTKYNHLRREDGTVRISVGKILEDEL